MSDAEILRGLTAPVTVLALQAGADALDLVPRLQADNTRLQATIAGLEDSLAEAVANARPAVPDTYTVIAGDTLLKIGRAHLVQVHDIKAWNGLTTDTIAVGQVLKLRAPVVVPVPDPVSVPTATTVRGINGRRAGMACPDNRAYYGPGALPATFNPDIAGGFPNLATVSWKLPPAEVLTGKHDARIIGYHRTAAAALPKPPAGHKHHTVPWHEPAKEIGAGQFTGEQHKAMQVYVGKLLVREGLADTWAVAPNYTGPYKQIGNSFDAAWLPTPDQLPPGSVITADIYGNPYGGTALDSQYPAPAEGLDQWYAVLERLGWWDSWGILEFNSPRRNHDPDETKRVAWLDGFVSHAMTGGRKPPKVLHVWEGVGVQWDQRWKTPRTVDWCTRFLAG